MNNQLQAVIFNIARCSLHDGAGLRTVVYFKGCGMRCKWCHNPESWAAEPELLFYSDKCIGCGRCLEHCPQGVHYICLIGANAFYAANAPVYVQAEHWSFVAEE